MLSNLLISALNDEVPLSDFLHRLLERLIQTADLVLEDTYLSAELLPLLIESVLGVLLLDSLGFFNCSLESLFPFFIELILLLLGVLPQGVLAVELHLHEVVILSVVLLDVGSDLLRVGLLESLYGFIVVLESLQLLFELIAALFKLLLGFREVDLHVLDLLLVLLLEVRLLLGHGLLVDFELALGVLLLLHVVLL